jgi:hypothetical protein
MEIPQISNETEGERTKKWGRGNIWRDNHYVPELKKKVQI